MKLKLLLLLTLSNALYAQKSLSVDELIKIALKNSPDIKLSKLDVDISKEHIRMAKGYYLPHLSLTAQGGKEWSKLKRQPRGDIDILSGSIGASQLLYDFGKTNNTISSYMQEELAYKSYMYQKISDKILQVKQTYYEILKAYEILKVQQKNLKLQQNQLYRAKKYLKAGIRTIIDVSDAKVRTELAKQSLNNARYRIDMLKTKLENILGVEPSQGKYSLYRPKQNIIKLSTKLKKPNFSLLKLEKFAYKHRHILKGSSYLVQKAKAQMASLSRGYYPDISLQADHSISHIDKAVLTSRPKENSHIMVNMQWNLFDGFQTDAKIQEAKLAMIKTQTQRQNIQLAIREEVTNAYIALKQSFDDVRLNQKILQSSKEKYNQAQKRYKNGLNDFIELQNAQQDYINALSQLANSYYNYFIAKSLLDHAIGR